MAKGEPLLLLTNRYPFGTGEEYLAEELPHLIKQFNEVIILPCMPPNSDNIRSVPDGVTVVQYRKANHRKLFPFMLYKGYQQLEERSRHPVHLAYDSYFQGRALVIADRVAEPVQRALNGRQPAVIYSYWFYITAMVGVNLRSRFNWDAPLISRAHGYDVNVHASPVGYLPSRPELLAACERVHPVSDAATNYLRETYPEFATKVSTRRLGTQSPPRQIAASRQPMHIVSCSMIRPLKRLELIGEAVELLQSQGYDVRWTHLGTGSGRYAENIYRRFQRIPNVSFLGYVPHEQIYSVYASLKPTAFVNVSTSEGVPVSIMEALACGIPSIATDVGGTSELLGSQLASCLVDADLSSDQLTSKITYLLLRISGDEYAQLIRDSLQRWADIANADLLYETFSLELASGK